MKKYLLFALIFIFSFSLPLAKASNIDVYGITNGTYLLTNTIYCIGSSACTLWRNGTDVTNQNNTAVTLSAGSWNYTASISDNQTTVWYSINKAKPVLILNNNTASVNTSGMVGYWRFENESLGYVTDYSGWNNTGTLTNMNNAGNTTSGPIDGRFGKALQFDGVNGYVETPTNGFSNNQGSIEMWMNPVSIDNKTQFLYDGANITLFDDFQDNNSNEWLCWDTCPTVVNGSYRAVPTAYGDGAFVGDEKWVNYTYEAKVRYLSGSSSFYGAFVSIAFRKFNVDYGNYFYAFVMYPTATSNQIRFMLRNYFGGFNQINATNYSFNVGQFYTLKIVADGGLIKGYVNGQYVLSMTDTVKLRGSVGIFSGGYAEIDDVKVENYSGVQIYKASDNNLTFSYGNITLNTSIFNWENSWHQIVATWDTSNVKLFADGNLVDSKTGVETPLKFNSKNWIGSIAGQNVNYTSHFNGTIDEVKIWNRSLTADEVKAEYYLSARKLAATGDIDFVGQNTNVTIVLANPDGKTNFDEIKVNNNEKELKLIIPYTNIDLNGTGRFPKGEHQVTIEHMGTNSTLGRPTIQINAA